jgi:hypothetical protein
MSNFFDIFKKQENGEEKSTVNLKVKIYVNKPEAGRQAPTPPMLILTKKKAQKFKQELSSAVWNAKDYVRINFTGDINPEQEKGKDYSFLAVEEMKAPK